MKKTHLGLAFAIFLVAALVVLGCSSNSNYTSPTGGGGGGQKEFDSGVVAPGGSFSHVFMTAKTVPYHCSFHGGAGGVGMSGTITVQAAGVPTLHAVSMTSSLTFVPADLIIKVGDTVKWTNNATMNHTATSDN